MSFCKILQASVAEKQLVMARSLLRRRGHLLVMYFFFHFLWRGPGSELRRPHGPLPWPTLLQLNFMRTLIFENIILRGILFFSLSLAIFAYASCHSRWSEKSFPRSLNVSLPRATLVAWWKQSFRK